MLGLGIGWVRDRVWFRFRVSSRVRVSVRVRVRLGLESGLMLVLVLGSV